MEMVIKIDKQGRVVLPKEIRDKYNFNENSELLLIEEDEGIMIKAKKPRYSLSSIFKKPLKFDPKKVLSIDIANQEDDDIL